MHIVKPMELQEATVMLNRLSKLITRLKGVLEIQIEQLNAIHEGIVMIHNGLYSSISQTAQSEQFAQESAKAAQVITAALTSPNGEVAPD